MYPTAWALIEIIVFGVRSLKSFIPCVPLLKNKLRVSSLCPVGQSIVERSEYLKMSILSHTWFVHFVATVCTAEGDIR